MGFFSFFKPSRPPSADLPNSEAVQASSTTDELTARQVFTDPTLLASWINEHYLESMPLSQDYDLLPNAEARADLEISVAQRDKCLREYSVLRISGASLFVKQHYEDAFWLQFTDQISVYLLKHIQTANFETSTAAVREAIEQYVLAGDAQDPELISTSYLQRVYDDNPNYIRMKVGGLGMLANDAILSSYDVLRDAYCNVMHGMSYEALKSIDDANQQAEGRSEQ
ncbi:hypothetical protein [Pseudomonas sp. MPC6]|uniref:hypothetical protein n=1 Tax=unclassified Pseudomonas TaxID=196821 RepID=UPI0011105710|nr:hypothetical protein [Pseudomonas sp. MPC6]QCY09846.1 hypothetical protein ELQ88_03060 [Pseudomonas sp. MPC6]